MCRVKLFCAICARFVRDAMIAVEIGGGFPHPLLLLVGQKVVDVGDGFLNALSSHHTG